MTISLREIAQHAAAQRIDLLRQQADVIAARQQPIEQLAGVLVPTLQDVIVDQPEAAGEKSALARRQPVRRIIGVVAEHEFVVYQQPPLDGAHRPAHERIIGVKKSLQLNVQQASVEPL